MRYKQDFILVALVVVCGFIGGLAAGWVFRTQPAVAQEGVEEMIDARALQIVDSEGNLRLLVAVGEEDGMPGIALYDAEGKARSVFSLSETGEPIVTFNNADGELRVAFGVTDEGGPAILMKNEAGKTVWNAP